jgi:hypothetical protein
MATEIGAADEVFHPAGDDDDWNESGWFGFNIAQRDINGFVYYFQDLREQARALIGPPAIR